MWKIFLGFVAFAALAVFVLMKGGDIDLTGEKHGSLTTPMFARFSAAQTSSG